MPIPPAGPARRPAPRVRLTDVDQALRRAGVVVVLPDSTPRGRPGTRLAQMQDAVLVVAGGGASEHGPTRAVVRTVLRDAGFIVKDSPQVSSLLYVLDRM